MSVHPAAVASKKLVGTSIATASPDRATRTGTSHGMHPLFRELFVGPDDGDAGPRRHDAGRRTAVRKVRTVRHASAGRATQGTWS